MRLVILGLGLAALPAFLLANGGAFGEFQQRRAALRKAIPEGTIVLRGGSENERGSMRSSFFQDADFLYLTGWREPGAALLISPTGEALFLPKRNEIRERYTGRKLAPGDPDLESLTGFAHVYAIDELDEQLKQWPTQVKQDDVTKAIGRLRMVKSENEIARIQHAVDVTVDAHKAAWARVAAGFYEYQIAASMTSFYFERGCERNAYPPIVASGPKAVTLHYSANRRRMDAGELLLMDVGAECSDYAADITRTVPVNGKFSPRQREIYEIVLGAQKAAIAAARPGRKLGGADPESLNSIALAFVNAHGKDLHGEPLGKYYLHGLGHHVGLDVHDPGDKEAVLEPGMVITIEPGIYIAEEGIGVRIEDMLLITADGARLMSEKLPREAQQIERAVHRKSVH